MLWDTQAPPTPSIDYPGLDANHGRPRHSGARGDVEVIPCLEPVRVSPKANDFYHSSVNRFLADHDAKVSYRLNQTIQSTNMYPFAKEILISPLPQKCTLLSLSKYSGLLIRLSM